jgi:uncharacterized membrane protein
MKRPEVSSSNVVPGVAKNIERIMLLEEEFLRRRSGVDRLSDSISRFAGSIVFVAAHVLFFAAWIAVNIGVVPGLGPFDRYPFNFLNLAVALEAIFLSTFVLMSQNRQNHRADHWAHLHLQIGLLAEQETTKILQVLQGVCDSLGLRKAVKDKELGEMVAETAIDVLAKELAQNLEKIRQQGDSPVDDRTPVQKPPVSRVVDAQVD